MSRTSFSGRLATALAAASALAVVACSDNLVPVQPDASGPALTSPALSKAPDVDDVVAGEVLVKLKDNASLDAVSSRHGLAKGRSGFAKAYEILLTGKGNERAMAARLAADPDVEIAEPNYLRHVDTVDPRRWAFYNKGGLNMNFQNDPNGRTGPLPTSYASIADADEDNVPVTTAGYAADGADVIIGSIDTGVDFTHPEFTGRLIAGTDWYTGDSDPSDTPDEGHGTHTTGTMAGSTVGVAGVSGAAPHVKVLVQRVCGANGCPTSAIVNAINFAAKYGNNLVAVNLSLGGRTESSLEKTAIANAWNAGVLVIASAGNSGQGKIGCPACDPNAIAVSSTTWRDELAPYSQYGSGLDLAAPGGSCYSNTTEDGCIFSSVATGYTGGAVTRINGGSYAYMQGTSMAAPQVTGTAAIVASKTGLRGAALRDRLYSTADEKGTAGYDTKFGNGRINSYRAVTGATIAAANDKP
jgi:serine protease